MSNSLKDMFEKHEISKWFSLVDLKSLDEKELKLVSEFLKENYDFVVNANLKLVSNEPNDEKELNKLSQEDMINLENLNMKNALTAEIEQTRFEKLLEETFNEETMPKVYFNSMLCSIALLHTDKYSEMCKYCILTEKDLGECNNEGSFYWNSSKDEMIEQLQILKNEIK